MEEGGGQWTRHCRKGQEKEAVLLVLEVLLNFTPFNLVLPLGGIGCVLIGLAARLYRYWRVPTPVERRQIRWVVFGIPLGLLFKYGFYVPCYSSPPLRQLCYCAG